MDGDLKPAMPEDEHVKLVVATATLETRDSYDFSTLIVTISSIPTFIKGCLAERSVVGLKKLDCSAAPSGENRLGTHDVHLPTHVSFATSPRNKLSAQSI